MDIFEGGNMAYQYILSEVKDRIGILTLNRPDKMNGLGKEMEDEITDCLQTWGDGQEVKVVIIKGNGKVFCSGHDRTEVLNGTPSSIRTLFQTSYKMMSVMRQVPMPIIAQVHGIAMAGGCHLAAACDLVVAAEKGAQFGMTGLKIGYNCSTPTVAVSRAVGQKKCLEMLFTGNLYSRTGSPANGSDQPGGARRKVGRGNLGPCPADCQGQPRDFGRIQTGLLRPDRHDRGPGLSLCQGNDGHRRTAP
jgi:1,4-dihydroxy-2-naphthoyl-CoA synthase